MPGLGSEHNPLATMLVVWNAGQEGSHILHAPVLLKYFPLKYCEQCGAYDQSLFMIVTVTQIFFAPLISTPSSQGTNRRIIFYFH